MITPMLPTIFLKVSAGGRRSRSSDRNSVLFREEHERSEIAKSPDIGSRVIIDFTTPDPRVDAADSEQGQSIGM